MDKAPFYIVYHGNCYDGFGAAWAAWIALGSEAMYIPANYGIPFPDIEDGAIVVMVDFSLPRKELLELKERCRELTVLDHHQTAQEELEGLDFAIFDLDKSGARLAWEYWHPYKPAPAFIDYIEDRDLWRFDLLKSQEFSAGLRSYPMDFEIWTELATSKGVEQLKDEGSAILRFTKEQVEMMCQQARRVEFAGHEVPVVNATAFWSEVATRLLELYPDAPFAGAYYETADGRRKWSLRSRSGFEVNRIAQQYGGGGHPQAAGFVEEI